MRSVKVQKVFFLYSQAWWVLLVWALNDQKCVYHTQGECNEQHILRTVLVLAVLNLCSLIFYLTISCRDLKWTQEWYNGHFSVTSTTETHEKELMLRMVHYYIMKEATLGTSSCFGFVQQLSHLGHWYVPFCRSTHGSQSHPHIPRKFWRTDSVPESRLCITKWGMQRHTLWVYVLCTWLPAWPQMSCLQTWRFGKTCHC